MPFGIESHEVGLSSWESLDRSASDFGRPFPSWREDSKREGEDIVVKETGVDGEQSHEEDDVSSIVERVEDLSIQSTLPKSTENEDLGMRNGLTSEPVPFVNFFSNKIKLNALNVIKIPWPISPNMTANKKGKVMTVNNPGLTSW